jgi:NAD(P)-dependent dehydrogenase (short-subunit alcohol dehydrogenase family)
VHLARVAVVTGASSGIGAAIARRLAADGWHCVLMARREEQLRQLAGEIGADVEVCDVSDRAAVDAAAERVRERHPAIALLVNNAGIGARGDFLTTEPEVIEQVLRTNYLGGIWCLRAFLPALEAAAPSHVVNIVSVAGTVALGASGPYAAAKHAQLAFSRSTAALLLRRGITVHTVNPGFVETPGFPQRNRFRSPLWRRIVIGPDDVARRVAEVVRSGKIETTVPRWYRVGALAQALAPGLLVRLLGRSR